MVRGWVVGLVFGSWVTAWVSSGCGSWVVDRRGWVVVVDRRAGMNGSLVVDRRLMWVVGRGWVVAEVAPMMIFLEWVCSDGFQIGWVWLGRGRGRGLLWSCLGFKSAPVMIFY